MGATACFAGGRPHVSAIKTLPPERVAFSLIQLYRLFQQGVLQAVPQHYYSHPIFFQ